MPIYKDNAQNRKLKRVGMGYGKECSPCKVKKKEELKPPPEVKKSNNNVKLNILLGYGSDGLPIKEKMDIIQVEKWFTNKGYNPFTDKQKKSIMEMIKEKNINWAIKKSKGKTDLYSFIPITELMGDTNNLGTFKIKRKKL
tara:strand:+ start:83 stop:505 length:423 start_codon:yes stop_codon:yes gene_type:complete